MPWAAPLQIIDGESELYGACFNVVRDAMKSDAERMSKHKMHAGAFIVAKEVNNAEKVDLNQRVKAHRSIHEGMSDIEKRHVKAKGHADERAGRLMGWPPRVT